MKFKTKLGRFSLLLLILLVIPLVLAACGGDDEDDDDNGDSDSGASAVENSEQFLEAIFEGDADAAKSAACRDVYDAVDLLVAVVIQEENSVEISSISCEQDDSTVTCAVVADDEEDTTTLTVDDDNRVCGGELIDIAGTLSDPSADETTEDMVPTMALPTEASE